MKYKGVQMMLYDNTNGERQNLITIFVLLVMPLVDIRGRIAYNLLLSNDCECGGQCVGLLHRHSCGLSVYWPSHPTKRPDALLTSESLGHPVLPNIYATSSVWVLHRIDMNDAKMLDSLLYLFCAASVFECVWQNRRRLKTQMG